MTRPLTGRSVVVTRPAGQARALVEGLTALGAEVIALPLTRVVPIEASPHIAAALRHLGSYEVVVVTSANGAGCFADHLAAAEVTTAETTTMVAVGSATAEALRRRGLRVDMVPAQATGGTIVAELAQRDLTGVRILLPRARNGRPELPLGLRRAGALVDDVAFYDTVRCVVDPQAVVAARDAHDIVLTAPSGVEALSELVDPATFGLRIVTIGPTTSAAVRRLGLPVAAESAEQSVAGLIYAIRSLPHVDGALDRNPDPEAPKPRRE